MVRHFVRQPLSSGFMVVSIIGFLFSTLWVWELDMTWGFTLTVFFFILFAAAVYNFTHAEDEEALDMHDSKRLLKKSVLYNK